ncbi:hypothetical protein MHBO_003668 [Bonamia ostreae]|uniref:Uncharacterized protein n=1 Tax=Bonamia ostreae TaxID=126728 RepID=A0ABV2AR81_9EUKA
MLLDWTFDPDENIFNPLIDSPTEFVQVHGDSFVHSIHFGKSSAYQINLSKSVFEEGIVQKDLKKSIDSFLNNEMSDKLTKWLKNTISAENCRVYRLPFGSFKAPEESEPITMNELKELLRLQNSQTALSPTVIDADISFYPDRIVAGALFKSREPFCSRFEQNVAPNCVDLFQSMRYLEHLADNLGSKNGEKTSLNEIKLREKAFDLKKNLLKAKEWTKKQSQMLNEISTLSLPDASNVFEGMDEEAENGNLIEKNKSYNRKTEDMEKMSFYKIDKSEKKIKDIKMATENMVSVNKVDYKTIVWLCIELTRALEKYSSQTIDSSSEIPKFVVFASFNKNVPTLLSNESHFGDFGPGLRLFCEYL